MHFKANTSILTQKLDIIEKAIPSRTTLDILENIFVSAAKDQLTLISTNLELGIKCQLPIKQYKEGKALLPVKLIDIVRHLSAEEVEFKIEDYRKALINADKTHFQLVIIDPEEYPSFSMDSHIQNPLILSQSALKEGIRQTIFAVSRDESRPAFNGILFKYNGEKKFLTLIASDTFRLVLKEIAIENWPFPEGQLILPAKNLNELTKILNISQEKVKIYPLDNQVIFEFPSTVLYSRVIDENYPDITQVLPNKFVTEVLIDTQDFKNALTRANLLTKGLNQPVTLTIDKEKLSIRARSDIGGIEESLTISSTGKFFSITFNCRFLLDFLKVIATEKCRLRFAGQNKALVMQPDGDCNKLLYLILPIKTDNIEEY